MAGMLPGVECARRRRVHQGGSGGDPLSSSRRSSFCLYASSHESHLSSSSKQRDVPYKSPYASQIGDLGNVAREAKGRLDEKLRTKNAVEITRRNSMGSLWASVGKHEEEQPVLPIFASLQREVFCSQKSKRRGFISWIKSGWKASEQVECVVCLEEFKGGEVLLHLPCAHRFHSRCVVPWLQSCSRCPCCRTAIPSLAN